MFCHTVIRTFIRKQALLQETKNCTGYFREQGSNIVASIEFHRKVARISKRHSTTHKKQL